jgi:hypothetical protein
MKYGEKYTIEEIKAETDHMEWTKKLTGTNTRIRNPSWEHDECEPDYEEKWTYKDHCFCPMCDVERQARLKAEYKAKGWWIYDHVK